MSRIPLKPLIRIAALGGAAYAVVKRRSRGLSAPSPPATPQRVPDPAPAPASPKAAAPGAPAAAKAEATASDPIEDLIAEEEAAAGAEAGAIGGRVRHDPEDPDFDADSLDPALQPVYEAGGGPSEGFEAAEADLIDNASHGGGRGNPLRDAPDAEAESDLSDAEYGEADHVHPADEDREDDGPGADERKADAPASSARFSRTPSSSSSKDFENFSTPSRSSVSQTSSRSTPAAATSSKVSRAPSTSTSSVGATLPWSRNASMVSSGIVFTVSGPMSAST